jgi:membrane protease YdiL (CAAX protease family)
VRPRIFYSRYGLRSGWRSLVFVFLFLAFVIPGSAVLRSLIPAGGEDALTLLATEAVAAASVLLATWICARFLDHKPIGAFGLARSGLGRRVVAGILAGFLALSLLVGLMAAFGGERIGGLAIHGTAIWRYGALWALAFFLVAVSEELLTRGYLLFTLTQGMGFWPAAILLSAIFAAGHLHNTGEQLIGIAAAGLIGIVLAWSVRWTGSLWWAIGFHTAWDWAESYFYGVPDSGTVAEGHLLTSSARGAGWLSGGSVGPEGSVIVLPVILLLVFILRKSVPRTPRRGWSALDE